MRIRDGDSLDPGPGWKKNQIRVKHAGSAILIELISYWWRVKFKGVSQPRGWTVDKCYRV